MAKPDSLQGSLDLLVLTILSRRPGLHGCEPAHDLGARGVERRPESLDAEPERPQLGEVHRQVTSRRHVVAPPMIVATAPIARSTRPPCHQSSVSDDPTDAIV